MGTEWGQAMAKFFVPKIGDVDPEEAYTAFAQLAGAGVPGPEHRVCSITWKHDGVVWAATVGEELRGVETVVKGRGRDKKYLERPRHTSDTVLAILSGAPFRIVHDNHSKIWNLPIYTGEPSHVEYFEAK